MFPLEEFRQKRSLQRQKKYLQKISLISWIIMINIYYFYLQLRVYYYIDNFKGFTL